MTLLPLLAVILLAGCKRDGYEIVLCKDERYTSQIKVSSAVETYTSEPRFYYGRRCLNCGGLHDAVGVDRYYVKEDKREWIEEFAKGELGLKP